MIPQNTAAYKSTTSVIADCTYTVSMQYADDPDKAFWTILVVRTIWVRVVTAGCDGPNMRFQWQFYSRGKLSVK